MAKQILNESANISVEFNGSTAYFHLPNSNLYNIYLNPNQTLRPYNNNGNPQLNFNALNWPIKFDKIDNFDYFFFNQRNNSNYRIGITSLGNGLFYQQNQLERGSMIYNCPYATGDIYFNVAYPSEYSSAGAIILPRHLYSGGNGYSSYAPAKAVGFLFNDNYVFNNYISIGSGRYAWINIHVHSGSAMNNYLYNYFAVSYRDRYNSSYGSLEMYKSQVDYSKITWTTMTNGYYNDYYKIRVYYNNPHYEQFNNLTNISNAFNVGNFSNRLPATLQPVCSDNVINMSSAYRGWNNCNQSPVCGNNVIDMSYAYYGWSNCNQNPVCGNNVIDMSCAYCSCYNLRGSPVVGNKVQNLASTYSGCSNLTGAPKCPNSVIDMHYAYWTCYNLRGSPECGTNVTNMYFAYVHCHNLTGSPVVGNNVINMSDAYSCCYNLTGSFAPTIGNFVSDLYSAYFSCNGIHTLSMTLYNARNLRQAFSYCGALNSGANLYLYYFDRHFKYIFTNNNTFNSIDLSGMFDNTSGRVNIHVVRNHEIDRHLRDYNINVRGYKNNVIWTDMTNGYYNASINVYVYNNHFENDNLSPYYGFNVMNLVDASYCYNNKSRLTGSPVCGDIIENMAYIYSNCSNLTGSPEVGNNVINMVYAYYNCRNLTGSPACGSNVINMVSAYYSCENLTGSPVVGPNVTNMYKAYSACYNLTGNPVVGNNVINMSRAFESCTNLTGSPVFGEKVVDVSYAYSGCSKLTGSPIFQNTFSNICGLYLGCSNLTGNFIIPKGFTNIGSLYSLCTNLTGNVQNIFNNSHNYLISIPNLFNGCKNLTGSPWCGPNINSLEGTYQNCINLTGSPICGENVKYFSSAYKNCTNLTGSPVCGTNVVNMTGTYENCTNLTGSPVCGSNVNTLTNTYRNCTNLTGLPVCGTNVKYMDGTYENCSNLTGAPVLGSSVSNISRAYFNCPKVKGTVYWNYSGANLNTKAKVASNTANLFGGRNNKYPRINLYVQNQTVFSNMYNVNNYMSIVGYSSSSLWTNYSSTFFYNTEYNIYVYSGSSYPTGSYTVGITGTGTNCLLDGNASYSGSSTTTTSSKSIVLTTNTTGWVVPLVSDVNNYITVKGSEFTYSRTNNTYATISLKNMAPTVIVNAKAVVEIYQINLTGNNLLINGSSNYSSSLYAGSSDTLTLTASGDFKLPILINLPPLVTSYARTNDSSGTLTISPAGTIQTITKTINAEIKRTSITYSLNNCTGDSNNPSECYDSGFDTTVLKFYFDGTTYKCPTNESSKVSAPGLEYMWQKVSYTEGHMTILGATSNNCTVSIAGASAAATVTITANLFNSPSLGFSVYESSDGSTYGNLLGEVDSGLVHTFACTTPYLLIDYSPGAYSWYITDTTGGISYYDEGFNLETSTSYYSFTVIDDGAISMEWYGGGGSNN